MKKLALCYSGQPRYLLENFSNHLEKIILPNNEKYEIDFFGHFWFEIGKNNFYDGQHFKGKQVGNEIEFFEKTLLAKKIIAEKQINFSTSHLKPDPRFPHPVFNTVSMFYSIEKANDLKCQFEKENNFLYDCSVRIRSDLIFNKEIIFDSYNMNKLNIEKGNPNMKYSMSDFFAFGNTEIMNKFSKTYSNIDKYNIEGCSMSSDILLGYGLHEDKERIVEIAYQYFGGFNLYNRI